MLCPETLCEKLERIAVEDRALAWFVQAHDPDLLAKQLIAWNPDRFGPRATMEVGVPKDGRYTREQLLAVWQSTPRRDPWFAMLGDHGEEQSRGVNLVEMDFHTFRDSFITPHRTAKAFDWTDHTGRALKIAEQRFNYPFLRQLVLDNARNRLAELFRDWCERGLLSVEWYCHGLRGILLDYLQAHAETVRREFSATDATRQLWRELDFALERGVRVCVVGDSRSIDPGAVEAWAKTRPGSCRLVAAPGTDRERDWLAAHADAFGLHYTSGTTTARLRRSVTSLVRRAGLFLVYSPARFILPMDCTNGRPAWRVHWIETNVGRRSAGCALVDATGSYKAALAAFVKRDATRSLDSWWENLPTVTIASVPGVDDLLAAARGHFPELADPVLERLAAEAAMTGGGLQSVLIMAARSMWQAAQRGRRSPNLDDVRDAIRFMAPAERRTTEPVPRLETRACQPSASGVQPARSDLAAAPQPRSRLNFPDRNSPARALESEALPAN